MILKVTDDPHLEFSPQVQVNPSKRECWVCISEVSYAPFYQISRVLEVLSTDDP